MYVVHVIGATQSVRLMCCRHGIPRILTLLRVSNYLSIKCRDGERKNRLSDEPLGVVEYSSLTGRY